jgi:hypothetical protein
VEAAGLVLLVQPASARTASPAAVRQMVDFISSRTSIAAATMTGRPDSASDRGHILRPAQGRRPAGAAKEARERADDASSQRPTAGVSAGSAVVRHLL